MEFVLIARDGTDSEAAERRSRVRPDHLDYVGGLKKNGRLLHGGAILDDEGKMTGSVVIYDFPDRQSLDEMLKEEPYILGKVWESIEIMPFMLAKNI